MHIPYQSLLNIVIARTPWGALYKSVVYVQYIDKLDFPIDSKGNDIHCTTHIIIFIDLSVCGQKQWHSYATEEDHDIIDMSSPIDWIQDWKVVYQFLYIVLYCIFCWLYLYVC